MVQATAQPTFLVGSGLVPALNLSNSHFVGTRIKDTDNREANNTDAARTVEPKDVQIE